MRMRSIVEDEAEVEDDDDACLAPTGHLQAMEARLEARGQVGSRLVTRDWGAPPARSSGLEDYHADDDAAADDACAADDCNNSFFHCISLCCNN